jgi:hypothetical protein
VPSFVTHRHSRTHESLEPQTRWESTDPRTGPTGNEWPAWTRRSDGPTDAPTEIDPGAARTISDEEEIE